MLSEKIKTLVATSLIAGVSLWASCTQTINGAPPAGEDIGASKAVYQQATVKALSDNTSHSASKSVVRLLNLALAWAADDPEAVEQEISTTTTIVVLAMLVIVGGGMIAGVWFRRRIPPLESRYKCTVEPTDWEGESNPPLMQTTTRYFLGDERFDPSFRIKTETEAFLGEYGVGIIPAVAQGERLPAFEVWLFDKHDPENTDSQLLVSEHAFHDQTMQIKLVDIGPLVLAQLGQTLTLQTSTLRAHARVLEMAYVISEKFDNRFFKELTVELAVWQLNQA